jgi:hypothetical protein
MERAELIDPLYINNLKQILMIRKGCKAAVRLI